MEEQENGSRISYVQRRSRQPSDKAHIFDWQRSRYMPKATSKAQQRKYFALANQGKITTATAKAHAHKGKSFKTLPARARAQGRKR